MTDLARRFAARLQSIDLDDRGDVPGWVFVTIMTAGLVTTLWIVAEDQLKEIFSSALSRVTR
jgi:hypothetical protein